MKKIRMQYDLNKAATNFIVVAAGILFYFAVTNLKIIFGYASTVIGVISPFIYGFSLAYIMSRPVRFLERKVFVFLDGKKKRPKLKRICAVAAAFALLVVMLALFFSLALPQLGQSIKTLASNGQNYLERLGKFAYETCERFNLDPAFLDKWMMSGEQFVDRLTTFISEYVPQILDVSMQITSALINILISMIISVYLLLDKERFFSQTKRFAYAALPSEKVESLAELARDTDRIFGGFITGKLINSFIIGVICYILMAAFGMPFPLLISVIIGVTDVIPFFGPFIGAVPSIFILLMVEPMQALWFAIMIIVLQQVDGNIIGPRILGDSTGLSAFWVMFAIIAGEGMFGFAGMLVGVPLFAVIYMLVSRWVHKRLKKAGIAVGDDGRVRRAESIHGEEPASDRVTPE